MRVKEESHSSNAFIVIATFTLLSPRQDDKLYRNIFQKYFKYIWIFKIYNNKITIIKRDKNNLYFISICQSIQKSTKYLSYENYSKFE